MAAADGSDVSVAFSCIVFVARLWHSSSLCRANQMHTNHSKLKRGCWLKVLCMPRVLPRDVRRFESDFCNATTPLRMTAASASADMPPVDTLTCPEDEACFQSNQSIGAHHL